MKPTEDPTLISLLADHYAGRFSPALDYLLDTMDPNDPLYSFLQPEECKWEGILSSWTKSDYILVTKLPLTQVSFTGMEPMLTRRNTNRGLPTPRWEIYICENLHSDGMVFNTEDCHSKYGMPNWLPSDFSPQDTGQILFFSTKEQALQKISTMAITWALKKVAKEQYHDRSRTTNRSQQGPSGLQNRDSSR